VAPILMSSFIYPWELADLGVETALDRMRDDGFGALELMSCYHPITLYTPGATGRRLMHTDEGGVFFPARPERYGRIRPLLPKDPELLSVWPRAAEAAGSRGLDLNSWTVALYQPWIAFRYPETARVTPEGHLNQAGVCPSSADVRAFLAALVGDLASQFGPRTVQLEGVTHPYVDTGMRLPRILVEWTPWIRLLASLCFCPSCVHEAGVRGVDVRRLRAQVVGELEAHYREGTGDPRPEQQVDAERRALDSDFAGFMRMREDMCVQLVVDVARALRASSPTTALGIWGPEEFDGTRLDLDRVLPHVSVLQTRQPLKAPENARAATELASRHDLRVTAVMWCGGRIGPPWGPEFEAGLRACVEGGVDQIQLFNWAMLSPRVAHQIVPMLRRVEAENGGSRRPQTATGTTVT
jgi:hypothetical protein